MKRFSDGETIYTATYVPDRTNATHVLAFLLVPNRLFVDSRDDRRTAQEVERMLNAAKRDALLQWYAAHTRKSA